MGLLSKKSASSAPSAAAAVTIIAQGTQLEGTLSLRGGIHVEGEFRGEILSAEHACVGTTGTFAGTIKGRHVLISGRFEGKIDCERLEITDTGLVAGEVICTDLVIDGGGRFSGSRRTREQELRLPASPTEPAAADIEVTEFHFLDRAVPSLIGTLEPDEPFSTAESNHAIA